MFSDEPNKSTKVGVRGSNPLDSAHDGGHLEGREVGEPMGSGLATSAAGCWPESVASLLFRLVEKPQMKVGRRR